MVMQLRDDANKSGGAGGVRTRVAQHFGVHGTDRAVALPAEERYAADEQRRMKGRRGLDILNAMQKDATPAIEVVDVTVSGAQQVDDKLIVLARQYRCPVITNDHNLGRVAELQGVKVLSLNQLSDAVRPPVISGQELRVTIRDLGREREQGISFLDDGTMIVVEDARRLIGQEVSATVTRVHQTPTGRIVFAHLNNGKGQA